MCRDGNFSVTESLEQRELQRLALKPGQDSHALLEKMTQVIQHENIVCLTWRVRRLLDHALLITLPHTRISLTPAQPGDGPAVPDGKPPSKRLTGHRGNP